MKGASKNKRHRTVCGLVFFLSVLQGFGSVRCATDRLAPSDDAASRRERSINRLAGRGSVRNCRRKGRGSVSSIYRQSPKAIITPSL